jgi:RNA polymerase sigma factor (TIGR02999 family)
LIIILNAPFGSRQDFLVRLDAKNLPEHYDPTWFHPDIFEREEQFQSAYGELRSIARYLLRGEAYSPTLETTELVNEAFLKLYITPMDFNDRSHVVAVLSRYMRQVLIDRARRKGAKKRDAEKVDLEVELMSSPLDADQWQIVGETLDELAKSEPLLAQVFDMHYFAGLQLKEIAPLMNRSERSVKRYWQAARLWLRDRLRSGEAASPAGIG